MSEIIKDWQNFCQEWTVTNFTLSDEEVKEVIIEWFASDMEQTSENWAKYYKLPAMSNGYSMAIEQYVKQYLPGAIQDALFKITGKNFSEDDEDNNVMYYLVRFAERYVY